MSGPRSTGRNEAGVAIVTGGGRGIGRACALRLAGGGFDVAVCALEQGEVEDVAADVRALGRRAHAAVVDVADEASVRAFATDVVDRLGPVSVLVNNAGTIELPDEVGATTAAQWDRTMNVNARGPFLFCSQVLPGMLERDRGRVINIASVAGLRGLPRRLAYTASKHALVGLTRSLAAEIEGSHVTVNAICPGAVVTRMTAGSRAGQDRTGWLQPDDLAATVAHLAGPDGGHIHGAVIALEDRSGGFTP